MAWIEEVYESCIATPITPSFLKSRGMIFVFQENRRAARAEQQRVQAEKERVKQMRIAVRMSIHDAKKEEQEH